MTRRRLAIIVAGATAALLIAASIASSLIGASRPSRVTSAGTGEVRLSVGSLVDRTVPDLVLRDERGRPVSLRDYRGRYLVLSPALTLCHEVCPMTTAVLEQIRSTIQRDGLGGDVAVAEATVDPWRDTPARLRAFRRMVGAHFDTLTGSPAQIARLWKFFGIYYKRVPQGNPPDRDWLTHRPERFDVEHADGLLIVDPRGHWRVAALGMPSTGGALPVALRRLLNDQGLRNLRHPDQPWTARQAIADILALRQHDGAGRATAGAAASPPRHGAADGRVELVSAAPAAFHARLARLHGRPVVVNEWASWCAPCRIEFPLLQRASARFGRRVAFVGVDVNDNAAQARRFLAQHPIGYPSYADPNARLTGALGSTRGLPTTIFLGRDGHTVHTHVGYYSDAAELDADIERYALSH